MAFITLAPPAPPPADEARWAAERKRVLRWTIILSGVVLLGLSGLLKWNYPTLRTPDGRQYEIMAQGRMKTPRDMVTVVHFLTPASKPESVGADLRRVLPFGERLAEANGDSVLILRASRYLWRYGLLSMKHTYHTRFSRRGDHWVNVEY